MLRDTRSRGGNFSSQNGHTSSNILLWMNLFVRNVIWKFTLYTTTVCRRGRQTKKIMPLLSIHMKNTMYDDISPQQAGNRRLRPRGTRPNAERLPRHALAKIPYEFTQSTADRLDREFCVLLNYNLTLYLT